VGQRKGLGGGIHRRLYVIGTRPTDNEVVVGEASDLLREDVALADLNWLATPPEVGQTVTCRLRHRGALVGATVEALDASELRLRLDSPQRAVTPGQSGAIYHGDALLGGGRIR
jgi:tRNA-uridine 2-sulfurtransferase